MRAQEELKTTSIRYVYNRLYTNELESKHGLCSICPPNRGCNYRNKHIIRNWKKYRKTQWE